MASTTRIESAWDVVRQRRPDGRRRMATIDGNEAAASVTYRANGRQPLEAIRETESYDGPSLVIAYAHCIAHGIDMAKGMQQQKLAGETAHWPLYRYDPRRVARGEHPLRLDSKEPTKPLSKYLDNEGSYRQLVQATLRPPRSSWSERSKR